MRNRKAQKEIRKMIGRASKEEKLDRRDYCGQKDSTPYYAVKDIINPGSLSEMNLLRV